MKIGTAYFGNRIVRHAAADMKSLARKGFNLIVHTLSENDLRFYYQAVCDIVEATHEAGHEVYIDPWGVGRIFGGEAFSAFVEEHSPDAVQILSDGKPGPLACPNNPVFRSFMKEWVQAAAATGAKTIFWDEPHFYLPSWTGGRPNTWGCLCRYCREGFEKMYGKRMPKTETDEVKAFKSKCLREFLKLGMKWGAAEKRNNALCVLPYDTPDLVRKKWMTYAKLPNLQVFGTDPYWAAFKQPVEIVGEYSREVKTLCDDVGVEAQVWIQGFKIAAGQEPEVARAIELAAAAGVRNLAVWGVDACHHLSWIRPADAEKTWNTVVRAFRRAAKRYAR